MKREILEQKITDALDGNLSSRQLKELEENLQQYPDLLLEYHRLSHDSAISELGSAIPEVKPHMEQLMKLRSHLEDPFYSTAVVMFKRYFLAASILIAIFASGMHFIIEDQPAISDENIYEWIYENNTESLEEANQIWLFSDLEEE